MTGDPIARAFRSSYAVLVDRAPLAEDDVTRLAPVPRRRSGGWRALAAAAVVLTAVGAAAWLVPDDPQPDLLAVGTAPFEPDVVVFLHTQVTDQELAQVRAALDTHPAVGQVTFFSQADAYVEAQVLFADDPRLLSLLAPDVLPPSLRLEAPRHAWPALVEQLEAMGGVVRVATWDEVRADRAGG